MSFEKTKDSEGRPILKVTTPEGRVYLLPRLSTKPLDPKLKAEGSKRSRAFRVGFQNAIKRAKKAGVHTSSRSFPASPDQLEQPQDRDRDLAGEADVDVSARNTLTGLVVPVVQ